MAKKITLYNFYNEADIPQFGCGRRSAIALPAGRKWITIVDPFTLDVAHVPLTTWQRMKAEPVEARRHVVVDAMKNRMSYFRTADGKSTVTNAIKEAYTLVRDAA